MKLWSPWNSWKLSQHWNHTAWDERLQSALESKHKALDIRLRLYGEDHPDAAESYYSTGIMQQTTKDCNLALNS